jgi:hypothetical protein
MCSSPNTELRVTLSAVPVPAVILSQLLSCPSCCPVPAVVLSQLLSCPTVPSTVPIENWVFGGYRFVHVDSYYILEHYYR